MWIRWAWPVVILFTVVAVGLPATAGPSAAAPSSSRVAWSKCYAAIGPFECGIVQVPLDYDHPHGPSIGIALNRVRAGPRAVLGGSVTIRQGRWASIRHLETFDLAPADATGSCRAIALHVPPVRHPLRCSSRKQRSRVEPGEGICESSPPSSLRF